MATAGTVHFSDFASATTLTGSESMVGLQNGQNVQITPSQLLGFVLTTPGTLSNKTVNTAAAGDSSGAIASTQFVTAAVAALAPTNAPTFTGSASFAGASFSGAVSFASRPSFGAYTPWDSGNFMPANYLPVTGGVIQSVSASGSPLQVLTASGTGHEFGSGAQQAYHDFHSSGGAVEDYDARISVAGPAAPTGAGQGAMSFMAASFAFNQRPTFAGAAPWDSANLPSPFQTTGGTVTGATSFSVRPTFAGAVPWDSANLPSPFQTTGGDITGNINCGGAIVATNGLVSATWVEAQNGNYYFNSAGTVGLSYGDGAFTFSGGDIHASGAGLYLDGQTTYYIGYISTGQYSTNGNFSAPAGTISAAGITGTSWVNSTGNLYYFSGAGSTVYFQFDGTQIINRGTAFYCDSDGNFNDVYIRSDQRLKTEIECAGDVGTLIDRMQVKTFKKGQARLKDASDKGWQTSGFHVIEGDGRREYGLLAHSIKAFAPDLVKETKKVQLDDSGVGLLSIDTNQIVFMLLKEVQSLRTRVRELDGK